MRAPFYTRRHERRAYHRRPLTDLTAAAAFYACALAAGAGGLIPAVAAFRNLPSGGVLLARPLALAAAALAAWLASGVAGIAYGAPLAIAALALPWAFSVILLARNRSLARRVFTRWRWVACGEAGLLAVFAVALAARLLYSADATFAERPLQVMLLTTLRHTPELPPPDLWLSEHALAYHHLLFLQVDMLARLAGIPPAVTLNLSGAAFLAIGGVAFAGVAADIAGLAQARRMGVAASGGLALLMVAASAPPRWLAATDTPIRLLGNRVPLIERVPQDATMWSPHPETPSYMLLTGSAHANVLAIALLAAGTTFAVLEYARPRSWRAWRSEPALFVVAAVTFAALGAGNPWSAPPCGLLWIGAGFMGRRATGAAWGASLRASVLRVALPALAALALAAPLLATLDASLPIPAPAAGPLSSPPYVAGVWGALGAGLTLALAAAAGPPARAVLARCGFAAAACAAIAWGGLAVAAGVGGAVTQWTPAGLAGAALTACAASSATAWAWMLRGRADAYWAGLAAAAAWLLLLVTAYELAGGPGWGRTNTLLKFTQPVWLWAACAFGAAITLQLPAALRRAAGGASPWRWRLGIAASAGACAAALAWLPIVFAIALSDERPAGAGILDAEAALAARAPGFAASARWAREHMDPRQHVIGEAATDVFPDRHHHQRYMVNGGFAQYGGVPAFLLTPHQQRHWRRTSPGSERLTANAALYLSADPARARAAGVTHVLTGPRERRRFGSHAIARFTEWPIVFEARGVRVHEVPAP